MYVVKKHFGRTETRAGDFRTEQEAIAAIMDKLKEDKNFNLPATYGLYEGMDLIKEYTQDDIPASATEPSSDSTGASGKGSGKSFAPNPFSTTPRLGPQTWVKDDNKDEGEDKDK